MKRFIGKIEENVAFVEGEELVHLKSVLRLKEGDEVCIVNGDGKDYLGKISKIDKNYAKVDVIS